MIDFGVINLLKNQLWENKSPMNYIILFYLKYYTYKINSTSSTKEDKHPKKSRPANYKPVFKYLEMRKVVSSFLLY